ncbi:MAG TPA: hypothetical protein VJ011_10395 [Steroidobacteraceae bacterium]|nr:hypothetical protein [Steroidobacteraceae bacterium]
MAVPTRLAATTFFSELLEERMGERRKYDEAMRRALSAKPLKLKEPGERFPTREELYDRSRIR